MESKLQPESFDKIIDTFENNFKYNLMLYFSRIVQNEKKIFRDACRVSIETTKSSIVYETNSSNIIIHNCFYYPDSSRKTILFSSSFKIDQFCRIRFEVLLKVKDLKYELLYKKFFQKIREYEYKKCVCCEESIIDEKDIFNLCYFCHGVRGILTIEQENLDKCLICMEQMNEKDMIGMYECKKHISHIKCISKYNRHNRENNKFSICPLRCNIDYERIII